MSRYDYGIHGVNVQVEYLDRVRARHGSDPSYPIRRGYGTKVYQESTERNDLNWNWFHLAIPTPTQLRGDAEVELVYINLKASTNENAHIKRITIHHGRSRVLALEPAPFLTGSINYNITNPDGGSIITNINEPIVLCLFVKFLTGDERGWIEFQGATAAFER